MDRAFRDVLEFHRKFGCVVGSRPGVPNCGTVGMRVALISEECDELEYALSEDDLPGIADSIADLIYVLLGTAVSYGIDLRPIWAAVHAANMAKVGGGLRGDGKVLKPPDWVAPDIIGILKRQGSLGEIPSGGDTMTSDDPASDSSPDSPSSPASRCSRALGDDFGRGEDKGDQP